MSTIRETIMRGKEKRIRLAAARGLLRSLIDGDDPESDHSDADDVLLAVLEIEGHSDISQLWRDVSKWYA